MEDNEIVQLFFARDEKALVETEKKYKKYLSKIASNILGNADDSEECVNDTYYAAWKSIPPQKPQYLKLYLAKIVKNKAIDLAMKNTRQKRGGGVYFEAVDDFVETIDGGSDNPEDSLLRKLDRESISRFLDNLSERDRKIFVRRFWFGDSSIQIAWKYNLTAGFVRLRLHRILKKLKEYLREQDS